MILAWQHNNIVSTVRIILLLYYIGTYDFFARLDARDSVFVSYYYYYMSGPFTFSLAIVR